MNCDVSNMGNQTNTLSNRCNGKMTCSYLINEKSISDPAKNCDKDYRVNYLCHGVKQPTIMVDAEAKGKYLYLDCLDKPNQDLDQDQDWVLIFRQSAGTYLSKNKWLSYNINNPDAPNYSILNTVNDSYKSKDGFFKFKLVYPKHKLPNFNIWKQKSNPITNKKPGVIDYQPININLSSNQWGGLEYNTNKYSLLDGSINSNSWYYAIGTSIKWLDGIPGSYQKEDIVELYIYKPSNKSTIPSNRIKEESMIEEESRIEEESNKNPCGCYTISEIKNKLNNKDYAKKYLPKFQNLPDDLKICINNLDTGLPLQNTPDDKQYCQSNSNCKFIPGTYGINICAQNNTNNNDTDWKKNYTIEPPFTLLGHPKSKQDCEKLCRISQQPGCAYHCNGCWSGPNIQPSLDSTTKCFQYAKIIYPNQSIPSDQSIPSEETTISKINNNNNNDIDPTISRDILTNKCVNFISYKSHGIKLV